FQDPWLKERDQLWYHEGKYEFSVAEIVDIIRHDQRLRGESGKHAAIVLPGGGVRGAYQAGILDALYDSHAVNDGFLRDSRLKDTMRLPIKTIVGTSGGALMGYLAARRSPWDTGVLTAPWPSVRPEHVFPPFGALRWLTIVVSVLILGVIAVFTGPKRPIAVPDNPRWLSFALAALVIAAPWLIWRLSMRDPAYFPKYEGMVFGVLVLAVHCIHTVLAPRKLSDGSKLARRKTDLVTGSLAAVAAIGLILRVSLIEWNWTAGADKDSTTFVEPLLAGVAIALGLAAILLFARWDSIRIDRPTVVDYGIGMVVLCLFIALTSALFAIVWWFDRVTVLELTGDYWRAAIAATVIASAVIVLAAHQVPFIGRGLSFLTRRFDREAFAYSPVGTLVIGGFVAFLAWTMLVAPAVYTGEYGANTFRKQAATVGPERARFVAAITTFGTLRMNERNRFAAGDYYAYERNGRPLGRADERFVDFPTKAGDGESDFLDAVNASGSPFPIYPGRYLRTYRGEEIFLDGGYTHLVPIEGAVLLGAKQILVVSNIAWRDKHVHPQTRRFFGMLVTDLLRTVSFLFDRSQQTDLTVQNDVLVATIAPTWPDEDPFLMDFRPTKIQELIAAAKRDADTGRPARVAKWGPPTIFLTVKD
ncbi:MAG TPA: patatin-like phospholipase family protein, partial [Thermoanaerobaculia bacterium]